MDSSALRTLKWPSLEQPSGSHGWRSAVWCSVEPGASFSRALLGRGVRRNKQFCVFVIADFLQSYGTINILRASAKRLLYNGILTLFQTQVGKPPALAQRTKRAFPGG